MQRNGGWLFRSASGVAPVTAIIGIVLALAAGCSRREAGQDAHSLSIKDDLGRVVRLSRPARRVVSLAPSLTEIVAALRCESRLVGVTSACDYPPSVLTLPRIGDLLAPNVETIVGLYPDLVLVSVEANTRESHERLVDLGLSTFVSNPRTLDGILKSIRDAGVLLNVTSRATILADSLQALRASVIERVVDSEGRKRQKLLLIVSLDPLMVAGADTFIDEMITVAGATNAGASGRGSYPVMGREEVLRLNPDMVLVSDDIAPDASSVLRHFPEWQNITASTKGRIRIFEADLFLRPGPRAYGGLVQLRTMIEDGERVPTRIKTR